MSSKRNYSNIFRMTDYILPTIKCIWDILHDVFSINIYVYKHIHPFLNTYI